MKKRKSTKIIALVLALIMLSASFGAVTVGASSAYPVIGSDSNNILGVIFADIVDTLLRILTDFFSSLFGDGPGFVPEDDAQLAEKIAANYYEGTGKNFQTSAQADAQWNLGYANTSLIPDDYDNGTYYIGGYIAPENGFSNVVEGIAEIPGIGRDDMKVRAMAISDGTGRGTVLFAVVDCIGITNSDIKDIRALLADYAAANNIVSINVASTHTHSCIDTEGLWTKNIVKLVSNGIINGTGSDDELQQGTNPAYMVWMKDQVANTLKKAHIDMKPGELTYTTKDLGQEYFNNKNRPSGGQLVEFNDRGEVITDGGVEIAMTNIERFIFSPADGSKKTMIINLAAHPDVAGLPTSSNSGREISGDYIFYCGQYLEKAGYNFIFFQGAIAGIYMARGVTGDGVPTKKRVEESQRYGYELARMALSLNLTKEQVAADPLLNVIEEYEAETVLVEKTDENGNTVMAPKNEDYTLWYENWNKAEDGVTDVIPEEVPVDAFLNLYIKQVEVPVSNTLITAIGKLNMANYLIKANNDGTYSIVTEIGYMELGNQFKTVFLPGEILQDIVAPNGASLYAANSITAKDFAAFTQSSKSCVADIFGEETRCFGLMNDAIGYVVPDNDYTMGDPANHYHELISLGQHVASSLIDGLYELSTEIVR